MTVLPPTHRWCISTLGCAELDLPAVIALAGRFGIRELELRALEDRLDLPAYFQDTFGSPEVLGKAVQEAGVRVTVLDTSLALVGNDSADREAFLEFLPWAEALQVPWLRVFDGGKLKPELAPDTLKSAVETIRWWRAERSRRGLEVDIAMETHDAFCYSTHCLELQKQLDEPLAILWDTHHTSFKAGESIADTWQRLRPFVQHVHFKDSVPQANATNPYTCALPGEGTFPLRELFAMLQRDGFDGAVCLEWERKWQPEIPPLEDFLNALVGSDALR